MAGVSTSSSLDKCCDSDGRVIDSAVASLKKYDELACYVIVFHYVYGISFNKISKISGKSRQYISTTVAHAEFFIAGQLVEKVAGTRQKVRGI